MTTDEEILAAFDEFKFALSAKGGTTDGLLIQSDNRPMLGVLKGSDYRVARTAGNSIEYPLGERFRLAGDFIEMLTVVRAALALVPDDETPL